MRDVLRPLLAAICLVLPCSCASNPLADGDAAREAGDWGKALAAYEDALSKGAAKREDVGPRIDDCRSKLAAENRSRAEEFLRKSDFVAAMDAAVAASRISPGAPVNSTLLARVKKAALADLEKKAGSAASSGDALAAVAIIDKARDWTDDADRLDAKAAGFLCDAAEAALAQGDFKKASSMAQAASAYYLGKARAAKVLRFLADRGAEAENLVNRARDARRDGRYEEAISLLGNALAAWPGHPDAAAMAEATAKEQDFWNFLRAGDVHLSRKEWAKAVEFFEKARDIDPVPAVVAKIREASLGLWMEEAARLERDRKADAVGALEKALEFATEKAPIEARIRSMKYAMFLDEGMALEINGEWAAALAAYEKAAAFTDDLAGINRRIAAVSDRTETVKCERCSGTGKVDEPGTGPVDCPRCGGKGTVRRAKR